MNYCMRCKNLNYYGNCDAAEGKVNIITGKTFKCSMDVQQMHYVEAYCGADGKWFAKLADEKE